MKKHFIAAFVAIILCLAMLAGCSVMQIFERDVQVVLKVNGEIHGVYTVNIFNNAVVTAPEAPEGTSFYGWTPQENWEELEQDEIIVVPNNTFIKYNDVKDFVKGEEWSVTLYACFLVIPPKDMVVAWYRAEGVSTQTGLDQGIMDTFTENMYAFLESKDYTPAEMDIVVRAYDKNVGTSCGNVKEDGDVDIMIGWAGTNNLQNTGGLTPYVDFFENWSNISVGTVARYAARKTNTELCNLVYRWIIDTYGSDESKNDMPEPENPDTPPVEEPEEPVESELPKYEVGYETFEIVIAWYDKEATSGLSAAVVAEFETALKAFLESVGITNVTITLRGYDGNVETSCGNIMSDNDVDLMLGWGSNINTTGKMKFDDGTTYYLENISGIKFGDVAGRYVTTVTDKFITNLVCVWVQNTYGAGGVEYPAGYGWEPSAPETPEEPPVTDPTDPAEPTYEYEIVIAWYAKSATSGISEADMEALKTALSAVLVEKGYEADKTNIIIRGYDGSVGDSCAAIKAEGDVDIMVGWSSTDNLTGTGGLVEGEDFLENIGDITIGSKARYAARLNNDDLTNIVFSWLVETYGEAKVDPEPTPDPEPTEKVKLVIGWYNLEATSGLNTEIMANFQIMLERYLKANGYNLDELEIVIRAYDGTVAEMGVAINADDDVDVLLGIGANITSTGKVDVVEKEGNIPMGGKSRYVALRVETVIGRLVYEWVKTEDGYASLASDFVVPGESTDPEPAEKVTLVVGWWSYKTSGLTQDIMNNFEIALKEYLVSQGYNLDNVELVFREYSQSGVADMGAAMNEDGDLDIIIGIGANITSTGKVDVVEKEGNIPMGGTTRYVALRVESELGRLVYEWVKTPDGYASLA